MRQFPDFMKRPENRVPSSQQNTRDVEGYYFEGADGSQVAFWECRTDRISERHVHDFDEYMICVSGKYVAYLDDEEIVLTPGDELHIPEGVVQWGRCIAGTRTIHFFGGTRIKR